MRRLLEPQAAREAAPTGSSSLACWPKRIDATFGKLSGTDDAAVTTRVESVATDGVKGYETYQIKLVLGPNSDNVYSIFGPGASASLL